MLERSGYPQQPGESESEPDVNDAPAEAPPAAGPIRKAPRTQGRGRRGAHRSRPVTGLLARAFLRGLSVLPLPMAHLVGGALGSISPLLRTRPYRRALLNLGLAFPELSEPERRRIARVSMRECARGACELGALWHASPRRLDGLVREVVGGDLLRAAVDAGRGVLVLAPHLGSWELICMVLSRTAPMTSLYMTPSVIQLDRMLVAGRGRFGGKFAPTSPEGVRALRKALGRGEISALLPDVDPGRGFGVFVPFFGVPANTMTLPARLARTSGATVLLMCAERLSRGRGFRVHVEPAPSDLVGTDPEAAAAAMNLAVERLVRRWPDQYLWRARRYRLRPDGSVLDVE